MARKPQTAKPHAMEHAIDDPAQLHDPSVLKSVLVTRGYGIYETDVLQYMQDTADSGGAPVNRVESLYSFTCVVDFHNHADAVNVVRREHHSIKGAQVCVFLYDTDRKTVYSGHQTVSCQDGGRKQVVHIPRVDPRAPTTVIVTGIPYHWGVTADVIKVSMEKRGNVLCRVKSVQCLKPVCIAIVEFERSKDARRVVNKVTVPVLGLEYPVRVLVLRPLPSDPADIPNTAHTAIAGMPATQTAGQQWRHYLMTMDVGQLQTLARAGGLTDDVKDTLRRVPRGEYKQQLITRCEALVSDNNIAQALLSILSQNTASHTHTATGDPHDARQSQATNTDPVAIVIPPATTPGASSVIPSTTSLDDTHLKTAAPAITPEVMSDMTHVIPPTATPHVTPVLPPTATTPEVTPDVTPVIPPTATLDVTPVLPPTATTTQVTPDVTPVIPPTATTPEVTPDVTPVTPPTATSDIIPAEECPNSEVEVFYDCVEEMDPATVHTA